MTQAIIEEVRAQASMVEPAEPWFLDSDLDRMRVLIRLTIEFFHFLQGADLAAAVDDKLRYVCDSVFSGIDSFSLLSFSYRGLRGARSSTLAWDGASTDSIKREFVLMYQEFFRDYGFEQRCRLLLDLFKLQIVFAGMSS